MSLLSTRRFAISRGIAIRKPIHACRAVPHVHLDDVHALLRLSYETLKGLNRLCDCYGDRTERQDHSPPFLEEQEPRAPSRPGLLRTLPPTTRG